MSDTDIVTLQSQDAKEFKVELRVARMSETIKNLIEDAGVDHPVPLPNVTGDILSKVIDYCKYHIENPAPAQEDRPLKPWEIIGWDADFVKLDQPVLFQLILAANYLDIKSLLELTCKSVANTLKGKTPDEICAVFGVKNDFTPEELETVRKENEWLNDN